MFKKIYEELLGIKKELQAIRSSLESKTGKEHIKFQNLSRRGVEESFEALSRQKGG